MAKFPVDVDESVTIAAPRERVYAYLWDVVRDRVLELKESASSTEKLEQGRFEVVHRADDLDRA